MLLCETFAACRMNRAVAGAGRVRLERTSLSSSSTAGVLTLQWQHTNTTVREMWLSLFRRMKRNTSATLAECCVSRS